MATLLMILAFALLAANATAEDVAPEYWEAFGEAELEGTGFFQDPQFTGQDRDSLSVAGKLTFLAEWQDGDATLKFTPYLRYDSADDRRSHWDIREVKLDLIEGPWSFTIGADTVFWGKTEAFHLVDVINQTDQVEDLDDEDPLGQPMVRVGYLADVGEFSVFLMPYFRERSFPGVSGRLRSDPPVNTARPLFDTSANEWTPAFALRYAGVIGDVDLGLHAFHGLGRDPAFFFDPAIGVLRPFYERTTQTGIDAQYTSGATLWKFEALGRFGQKNARFAEEDFFASTGGLEHTLFGIFDSNADLGLITEYAYDSRGEDALTSFNHDAIFGTRLALNDEQDTSFLLTGAVDLVDGSSGMRIEAESRVLQSWKVSLEAQAFLNIDRTTPAAAIADDSFARLKLTYFFGTE